MAAEVGMFFEHGPYRFEFDALGKPAFKVERNNDSWNGQASVMYLDYPLSSGFTFLPSVL